MHPTGEQPDQLRPSTLINRDTTIRLRELSKACQADFDTHDPSMATVQIVRPVEEMILLETEATLVVSSENERHIGLHKHA